ncbi:hypothetical protein [Shewanella donghaensis]|uniref:hypothetical protein n=1 Tax=Shewanella donghaensis TaxID=238836 RepID=UPI001181F1F1|nr:hypothetical protein [Shewanella donghaensis]
MSKIKTMAISGFVVSITLLAGCGGSSDSSSETDDNIPDNSLPINVCETSSGLSKLETSSELFFNVEQQYSATQSATISAGINNQNSANYSFKWRQTAGPTLELTSENSPILAFYIPQSANYSFTVDVTNGATSYSEDIDITAIEATNQLNIYSDHQTVAGNGVSLRLSQISNQTPSNIEWCYFSGQEINLDLTNSLRPLFTAPEVTEDMYVGLKATAEFAGETLSDEVFVLVTKQNSITSPYFDAPVAQTYPFISTSAYANNVQNCVYSNQLAQTCQLSDLPLIGQDMDAETIADVMDRVVVSHDWMGRNFQTFLTQADPNSDFIKLLQSVTAVVISYDVRPSFYWVATGAIYLDPEYLWLTAAERDTINEAPDYRSDFGNDLKFIMPWRYVKNNDYVSKSYDREVRQSRTINDITPRLASLMYHELAHANDFFPRSTHSELQGPTLIDDFYRRTDSKSLVSDQLQNIDKLTSSEMYGLAGVSFQGDTANATQKAYGPSDITSFFLTDHANDFYNYSSTREDAAMLFEEAFMSHRYQIQRDVAVTDVDDLIVDWGQRGRIGTDELLTRAAFVIDEIMPEVDGKMLVNGLPDPINMTAGDDWFENIDISPSLLSTMSKVSGFNTESTNNISDSKPAIQIGREHRDMPIPKR